MSKPVQIFLCHASEDRPRVIDVYHFLKQRGFKPWLDKEDLLPGQRWDQEIPKALKTSDFVLIFFSPHSVSKRGYVQKEFSLALDVLEEIPEGQIFVIPVRIEICAIPARFQLLQYCDLFEDGGLDKIVNAVCASMENARQPLSALRKARVPFAQSPSAQPQVLLRALAVESFSVEEVKAMLRERDLFDFYKHKEGSGLKHQYEAVARNWENLVIDHATGLSWQQGGSESKTTFANAQDYAEQLNRDRFAGCRDWRLPTLEEVMSLMAPLKNEEGLYIDPVFDKTQAWIWTSDKTPSGRAWSVYVSNGSCYGFNLDSYSYVRAVRSGNAII